MIKITVKEMAAIKRIAQNVNKSVKDRDKALEKIVELEAEVNKAQKLIDANEMGVKVITDDYTSEDLVDKVVETTDKVDAKGNPIKVTKYVPSSIVEYNEEDRCYYVPERKVLDEDANYNEPETEE